LEEQSKVMPPVEPSVEAQALNQEHLRLLSIGYYISGAFTAVAVSFLLFHLVFLSAFALMPDSVWQTPKTADASSMTSSNTQGAAHPGQAPPRALLAVFAGLIGFIIVCGWTLGALTAYAGKCIKERKRRSFVLVIAAIKCFFIPYGTAIGIATFFVLSRPAVKGQFTS
jgi:hypothetical protein